ncbi:hypothetical protein GGI35DRAFT_224437 [Trichoderma velutinum]
MESMRINPLYVKDKLPRLHTIDTQNGTIKLRRNVQTRLPSVSISILLHHSALPSAGAKILRLSASASNQHAFERKSTRPNQRYFDIKRRFVFPRYHHQMETCSRTTNCRHGKRLEVYKCEYDSLLVWRMRNANIPALVIYPLTSLALHKRMSTRTRVHLPAPKRRSHPQPSHLITLYRCCVKAFRGTIEKKKLVVCCRKSARRAIKSRTKAPTVNIRTSSLDDAESP